jgi:hypothetical protein
VKLGTVFGIGNGQLEEISDWNDDLYGIYKTFFMKMETKHSNLDKWKAVRREN